jgi:hypothetical protein
MNTHSPPGSKNTRLVLIKVDSLLTGADGGADHGTYSGSARTGRDGLAS